MEHAIDTILTAVRDGDDPARLRTMIREALTRELHAELARYRESFGCLVAPEDEFSERFLDNQTETAASPEEVAEEAAALVEALAAYREGYLQARNEITTWLDELIAADLSDPTLRLKGFRPPTEYAAVIIDAYDLAGRNRAFLDSVLAGSFGEELSALREALAAKVLAKRLHICSSCGLTDVEEAKRHGFNTACETAHGLLQAPVSVPA